MRIIRNEHLSSKKIHKYGFFFLILLCISCVDNNEKERGKSYSQVFFVTSIAEGETNSVSSRAASSNNESPPITTSSVVINTVKLDAPLDITNGKSLYLHKIISNISTETEDSLLRTTRAGHIKSSNMYEHFGVYGYKYPASDSWSETLSANFMENKKIKSSTGETMTKWPGSSFKLGFFAYAPYNATNLTLPTSSSIGSPKLIYKVPTVVLDQQDLLLTKTIDISGAGSAKIPLQFKHVLTGVRFKLSGSGLSGNFTSFKLKNIYSKANFNFSNETWSGHTDKTDFVYTPGSNYETTDKTTFMMIPQKLPQDAVIEVFYEEDSKNYTFKYEIGKDVANNNNNWVMGKSLTYLISKEDLTKVPVFEVEEDSLIFSAIGEEKSIYRVKSYINVTHPGGAITKEETPWKAEFWNEETETWTTTKPSWLKVFTQKDNGSTTFEDFEGQVQTQSPEIKNHKDNVILREASPVSNYNLSNSLGGNEVQNTANCYIINAPGSYLLPTVYGNAIKNSSDNKDAYTHAPGSEYPSYKILEKFKCTSGNIETAWIEDNNQNINDATLVWEDVENLILNVSIMDGTSLGHSGKKFVSFTVNRNKIKQGNAIIAVRDSNQEIIWSWHIWVTHNKFSENDLITIEDRDNKRYTIMPEAIGTVYEKQAYYPPRLQKVRFIQMKPDNITPTGLKHSLGIRQKELLVETEGNAPYYQWGRKDPMLPGIKGNQDKKHWPKNTFRREKRYQAAYNPAHSTSSNETKLWIQTPNIIYVGSHFNYKNNTYFNNWNNGINSYGYNTGTLIKTVYDPSPVGFMVPPNGVFNIFSQGGNPGNQSLNVLKTPYGWYFYTRPQHTGDTFFLASFGGRWSIEGSVSDYDNELYVWTNHADIGTNALVAFGYGQTVSGYIAHGKYYQINALNIVPLKEP